MSIPEYMAEAIKRMKKRNTTSVVWTLKDMTIEWSYTTQPRNYDGSFGSPSEDPVLQLMIWKTDSFPRYSVYY